MEKIERSKRLKEVAGFVKEDEKILDIGSDHAYLPIYLLKTGKVPAAIAGEVVKGPYYKAKEEIARYDLTEKIDTRLGSGFDVVHSAEKLGTVFICGMGGLLVAEIIEKGLKDGKIGEQTRLVLQANNKEYELRQALMAWDIEILEESIVKEKQKYYEIIVSQISPSHIVYTENELRFGPKLLEKKPVIFKEKWQNIYEKNQQIIEQLDSLKHQKKVKELKALNQAIEKGIK